MVNHPGEYRWSSYAANAYGGTDPMLTPHPVYEQLGSDTKNRVREEFPLIFPAGNIQASIHSRSFTRR